MDMRGCIFRGLHEHRFQIVITHGIKRVFGFELTPDSCEYMMHQYAALHCIQPRARRFRPGRTQPMDGERPECARRLIFYHRHAATGLTAGTIASTYCRCFVIFYAFKRACAMDQVAVICIIG